MPNTERDLVKYWKSISSEFAAVKDRIRDLIADAHWLTDGEGKEIAFRRVLSSHICESVRVGRGFVSFPEYEFSPNLTSTQIDVLISSREHPTIFKEGDLAIVTPDAVTAIVEVKTSTDNTALREALVKLADNAEGIRRLVRDEDEDQQPYAMAYPHGAKPCWAGLFVFEGEQERDPVASAPLSPESQQRHEHLLEALRYAAGGREERVINAVAWGPDLFARYWERPHEQVLSNLREPGWHSYSMPNLVQEYFLGNLVAEACHPMPFRMQKLWFPIEGGKESYRKEVKALRVG